ncbi:MAG: DUF4191 domain-containing protein [Egibacteraceae bacterium]
MKKVLDRVRQLRIVFAKTRAADPRLVPLMLLVGLIGVALGVGLGLLLGGIGTAVTFAILFGLVAAVSVFGRRATNVQFEALEGQPAAAAAVLQTIRGPWEVTLGVAVTRKKDLVHLMVGRPGVVLVGEGAPARVTSLLKQQRRAIARVAGDAPIHEISVGNGQGQVPLKKLTLHVNRLPRRLKARQVGPLHTKVAAVRGADLSIPKGPMPKVPKRMR